MSIISSVTRLHRDVQRRHRLIRDHHARGLPAKARATPMRCFCPPESWRGMRCSKARGSFTKFEKLQHAVAPLFVVLADAEFLQRPHDLEPTVCDGFSVSNGFWNNPSGSRKRWRCPRFSTPSDWISCPRASPCRPSPSRGPAAPWRAWIFRSPTRPTMATVSPRARA